MCVIFAGTYNSRIPVKLVAAILMTYASKYRRKPSVRCRRQQYLQHYLTIYEIVHGLKTRSKLPKAVEFPQLGSFFKNNQ